MLIPVETKNPTGWEKDLKEFQEECKEEGVPSSVFSKKENSKIKVIVSAKRSVGKGSEVFKNQIGREILQILPLLPDSVKVRHVRNYIANLAGNSYLKEIWPEAEVQKLPTDDESKAQDENAGMLLGVPPIWTPTQNNLAHATIHIQFVASKMQELQQGGNVQAFLQMFSIAGPHIEQTVKKLQSDNTVGKQSQELWNVYQQIVNQVKKIASDFQQAEQAKQRDAQEKMAQMNQIPSEQQIKMAEIQANKEVGMAKVKADSEIKAAKAAGEMGIKRSTAASESQLKNQNAVKRVSKE